MSPPSVFVWWGGAKFLFLFQKCMKNQTPKNPKQDTARHGTLSRSHAQKKLSRSTTTKSIFLSRQDTEKGKKTYFYFTVHDKSDKHCSYSTTTSQTKVQVTSYRSQIKSTSRTHTSFNKKLTFNKRDYRREKEGNNEKEHIIFFWRDEKKARKGDLLQWWWCWCCCRIDKFTITTSIEGDDVHRHIRIGYWILWRSRVGAGAGAGRGHIAPVEECTISIMRLWRVLLFVAVWIPAGIVVRRIMFSTIGIVPCHGPIHRLHRIGILPAHVRVRVPKT